MLVIHLHDDLVSTSRALAAAVAVVPIAAARADDAQGVASSRMSYSRFLEYLDMGRVKKVSCRTLHVVLHHIGNDRDYSSFESHFRYFAFNIAVGLLVEHFKEVLIGVVKHHCQCSSS